MGIIKEWLHKRSLKHQIIEVFQKAGLYTEHQTRGGKIPIYPKVHAVFSSNESVKYVFTIPNGLDPKTIEKKWFCFQQIFGRNVAIEGDIKKFVLNVFHSDCGLKQYNYSYKQWQPFIKECRLPIVVGRDQFGNMLVYDMVNPNTPHLLIAGETGSGKSSMVRVVLSTLIQCVSPDKLYLYLGDLKNSEFHFLRRVKHVKEVCMEEIEMKVMLHKVWNEIRERRKLMEEYEVDHIDEYNKLNPDKQKPYILLAIDEVAMLQDEKECMTTIEKISAVGRALGVFLMLSMQRPDAKVLDGKLKLNMTVRMGFKCDNTINSNIMGTSGSEHLEQSGQMILKLNGLKKVQAPYLELNKAKQIVEPYRLLKEDITFQNSLQQELPLFGVLEHEE
ncbi:TPA: FtsK/SpoIIIE domain-containing protein [Bacillus thuringiensis]|uniref:Cell division FtsK/SpoIIIE n=8 Tax=root TaxID=1 RepID=I7I4D7_9CAUD|nr:MULTISPECIES: FtsK/SpoIIIE domain-containing protein [Bacillus cereus group]YP_006488692.1 FtsK/SpoIIIE-like protein [Bacillus phage BtCS33]YP_006560715.1 FtsK/SpoIIIE-like protein [Staphylococcus phage SpaA1]YP_009829838.1 FtsK/SpoIIIE-like protein [Bacillus phage BceA1]ALN97386.1 FtsK/SpoIIIE family protein [Bacillus phage phi4I1]AUO78586.1 FtsK/SpoIIIE family protein [Bacillus phage BtiUFT6.51-F]AFL46413.1 cell division FtsK/SpoIIIE protein [Bacillus phage BtCS33]AGE76387.1 cell divisi